MLDKEYTIDTSHALSVYSLCSEWVISVNAIPRYVKNCKYTLIICQNYSLDK